MERRDAEGLSADQVLARLQTSAHGLSTAEAARRRARYGPNALTRDHATALDVLGRQFQSALVYFLVVAAILSFAIGDVSDGTIIAAILLINAALGFSQEYRSERAVEQLSRLIRDSVLVVRDGAPAPLDVDELAPGDVVVLKQGDVVPADVKLLAADNLQVDESLLTGESIPVAKAAKAGAPGGDASLLFAGSTLAKGVATGVVYATGNDTALGRIAALSAGIRKVTQYERSLRSFSTLLLKVVGAALAATLAIKVVLGGVPADLPLLIVFVVALAVAVVPEALPVIATLTLARGALALAKEKVVVKRLSSLEDLGNVTLLCTDKTGTLTENKLTIQRLVSSDDRLFQVLASATIDRESAERPGTQTSFDAAFAAFIPAEIKHEAESFTVVKELPFDPAARRRRVVVQDGASGARYLVVIGSAETLLEIARCPTADEYRRQVADEGRQGLRHLALAYRRLDPNEAVDVGSEERDLAFLGCVTLADPLRASTPRALALARELGVSIKILTGDSTEVAGYVARQVGLLPEGGRVYTGDELGRMSHGDFEEAVSGCAVFARVSPEQKFAIIRALKDHSVVAYQGDGINDAPALKLADVAIAVDSATDVAKASADIILLDKDLGVIVNGIRYGRAIFANINKYIKYTMVGNFGNFLALAALYLLSTDLPLLPRQVLLISLLTDLPLVAISTDAVGDDELRRPAHYNARTLLASSLVLGTLTALFELAFFATVRGQAPAASQTSLYLFFSFTQLVVILSIRNRDHFWKAVRPSRQLVGAIALTAVVALAIPAVPPLARLFSFSAPSLTEIGIVLLVTAVYVLVLDLVKVWYYRVVESEWVDAPTARAASHA